jgi:hypothetical protein
VRLPSQLAAMKVHNYRRATAIVIYTSNNESVSVTTVGAV